MTPPPRRFTAETFDEMKHRASEGCTGEFVGACCDPELDIHPEDWCNRCLMGVAVQSSVATLEGLAAFRALMGEWLEGINGMSSERREKLDKADLAVFCDGLREFPIEVVTRVCDELGRISPEEFQPRFPPLHALREQCHKALERQRERRRQLTEGKPPQADPDRLAKFLEDCKAAAQRKVMP